jgi:MOSC domain-containing protein YiiM
MKLIPELLQSLPQIGRLEWIGLSGARRSEIVSVHTAELQEGYGLAGDHHSKKTAGAKRQVTLIQAEHLVAVGQLLHRAPIEPAEVRRNLVISGINLLALKGQRFSIGTAVLEGTGPCEPCSRMEENLGPGGYNAMRGHGGLTAKVITGGPIQVGDQVKLLKSALVAG